MKVYQYDGKPGNLRLPHHSGIDLDLSAVTSLGVEYYHAAVGAPSSARLVDELSHSKGFAHRDEITYSPAAMGDAYETNIEPNWREHIHEHDEIRYVLAGSGYFDIRAQEDDKWMRMAVAAGDLIVLPRGSYHRFGVDTCDDITMTRLFPTEDTNDNIDRDAKSQELQARSDYLETLA